jgi:hypothetical protein
MFDAMLSSYLEGCICPAMCEMTLIDILEALLEAQLRAIRKMRRSLGPQIATTDERGTKRMSHADIVHEILRTVRRPLHITEILKIASESMAVDLDRESVVSTLAKRVTRKDRFTRTAPNTFALLPER